jgi:hypothetical protein
MPPIEATLAGDPPGIRWMLVCHRLSVSIREHEPPAATPTAELFEGEIACRPSAALRDPYSPSLIFELLVVRAEAALRDPLRAPISGAREALASALLGPAVALAGESERMSHGDDDARCDGDQCDAHCLSCRLTQRGEREDGDRDHERHADPCQSECVRRCGRGLIA